MEWSVELGSKDVGSLWGNLGTVKGLRDGRLYWTRPLDKWGESLEVKGVRALAFRGMEVILWPAVTSRSTLVEVMICGDSTTEVAGHWELCCSLKSDNFGCCKVIHNRCSKG